MKLQQGKVNRIHTNEFEHDTQFKTAHLTPSSEKEFCSGCGMWKHLKEQKLCTACTERRNSLK